VRADPARAAAVRDAGRHEHDGPAHHRDARRPARRGVGCTPRLDRRRGAHPHCRRLRPLARRASHAARPGVARRAGGPPVSVAPFAAWWRTFRADLASERGPERAAEALAGHLRGLAIEARRELEDELFQVVETRGDGWALAAEGLGGRDA